MSKYRLGRVPSETLKVILNQEEIREKIFPGIQKLADAVGSTLGPNGKNVIIKLNMGNVYTKDGVTVAKHVDFDDKFESLGAEMVKEVAKNTCDKVGDGTTQSIILAEALIRYGLEEIKNGRRVDELAREIRNNVDKVVENIKAQATPITTEKQTIDIATISANDRVLGEMIGGIYNKIGVEGVVITEDSGTTETFVEEVEGMRFNSGLISPYFITNYDRQRCELDNPYIFISDLDLSSFVPFISLLNKIKLENNNNLVSLIIIANRITGEALANFLNNHLKGYFKIACIEAPYSRGDRERFLEDLAVSTGGKFLSRNLSIKIQDMKIEDLGRSEKAFVGKDTTTIVNVKGNKEDIENRIKSLEEEKKTSPNNKDLDLRLSRLKNKISVLKVGGQTDSEIREKKYRVEDAVESTKVALQGGIVVGGEIAIINAIKDIVGVVYKACLEPFKRLLTNIDKDPDEFLTEVGGNIGYNATTEVVEDLFENGIIDPALVPITALSNAASVAINFLKTGNVVFNQKDLDEPTDQPLSIE